MGRKSLQSGMGTLALPCGVVALVAHQVALDFQVIAERGEDHMSVLVEVDLRV